MKPHKSFRITAILIISTLLLGLISGCSTTREKKLRAKGFTLMYKSKSSAGYGLEDIRLRHPVKLSEDEVRHQLKSLTFEELSLFGKKKPVFTASEIRRIERLITKAINRVPGNKIIYYELETPGGTTAGDIFASAKILNWRFSAIQGKDYSNRSFTGWGGAAWRMVLSSGQKYHATKKLLGVEAQENWVEAQLHLSRKPDKNSRVEKETADPQDERKRSRSPSPPTMKQPPASATDPDLEQKLQFLKDLHEKKLIDEKEYQRKRKELLDTYL